MESISYDSYFCISLLFIKSIIIVIRSSFSLTLPCITDPFNLFISGGLTWFAIPFSLATTMGLAYLGLSSAQGAPLLTDDDVAKGEWK